MIPPHLSYQIYLSFLEQNDCTPPKCGELSEYTDSTHTEVENASGVYDRCVHDTRQLHPSCTACRRTANLPGLATQNESCSQPHHFNGAYMLQYLLVQIINITHTLCIHWLLLPEEFLH